MFGLIVKQARVSHWHKNLILFIPAIFVFPNSVSYIPKLLIGFVAFSLCASAVYVLNDIVDRDQDRLHQTKKNRPIASGKLSLPLAYGLLSIFLLGAFSLSWQISFLFFLILIGYLLLNFIYSIRLKHIVVIDIILIAFMYLMRVYAGTAIIEQSASSWIQITIFAGSLFLITAKRYSELVNQPEGGNRKILEFYPEKLLELLLTVSTSLTLVFYGVYIVSKAEATGNPLLILTFPFVVFGMFRYCFLVFYHNKGEAPEKALFDPSIIISMVLWSILSATLILGTPEFITDIFETVKFPDHDK